MQRENNLQKGPFIGSLARVADPAMSLLFQTRCPHCRARVEKRDQTCPGCERWIDDHPDRNDARKWRRRTTIGAVLFFTAVLVIWILTRR